MSLQYCSITGEPLQEAVVSRKSGHIFEKRIIEKQIQATGQCPITDKPLDLQDLIPVKLNQNIKPRPSNATSIPNIVNILQNEWDVVMLETYNLKQHLETVRQELSHALYQHDAACRVISRVIRERDEARKELAELYAKLGVNPSDQNGMAVENPGLPQEISQEVEQTALTLNKQRKANKKDPNHLAQFPPVDTVSQYSSVDNISLHSTTKPGITCLKIHPEKDLVVTGGIDGSIILYDKKTQKILQSFNEVHKKQINDITFVNYDEKIRIFSAGQDGVVNGIVFDLESNQFIQTYNQNYSKPVTAIDVLPIHYVIATSCQDGTFTFHDARANKELLTVKEYENNLSFTGVKIHPDGHFAALGCSDSSIIIWNIFQNNLVAQLKDESANGEINTLAFSENGYTLASGSKQEGKVRIWDLRKQKCVKILEELSPEYVVFDISAQILAVADKNLIKLYNSKNFNLLSNTEAHTDKVTSIAFAPKTQYFVTCSLDRHLIFHSQ
ncbi:WD40-repeat-containing domain [Pseudocohnilembus persalinus]|uniref:Pre-mRNA-processing factor 19 n=1 Tax=Pseudocohnilembus persalinus TaxID=266149 RepID=A0A0V0QTM0_PSEPJ|nr:WD40-repeat-containing domain [Pseudocohnilembus persalinus]|eukprot:KRX05253.1 WD40-repeat-containing domain [Pseudocohnilembus persalinus]